MSFRVHTDAVHHHTLTTDQGLPRFWVAVAVTTAFALSLVLLPLLTLSGPVLEEQPPPPRPGIRVVGARIATVPPVGARQARDVEKAFSAFVVDLYERAFIPAELLAERDRTTAAPRRGIARFFTAQALKALRADRGVFRTGRGLTVRNGRLRLQGVTTIVDNRPTEAMLAVQFRARSEGNVVEIRQRGTLRLVRTKAGLRVGGFDLALSQVAVPKPTPTPEPKS